jgi:hypothetical protein
LLEADDDGQDPVFDPENVDVEKLAGFLLNVRSELIGKTQPGLTREAAFAAACEAHPEIFKAARDARRAKITARDVRPAAAAARHYAMHAINQHAAEIRKASPGLGEAASRIEARRRFPDIAARERTALA